MRCLYCRPRNAAPFSPARHPLTSSEIESLVRHLVLTHGLSKVRLTGGEPTSRGDLLDVIRRLRSIESLGELAMTTNGLTLASKAPALAAAGLSRVNISLDSLDPAVFGRMTGVNGLPRVLAGIDAAVAVGLHPVKLNTVVVRGMNDHEPPALLDFAARRGLEIRFIELMPMGPLADRWAERYVPEAEVRRRLDELVACWVPLPVGPESARRYDVRLADGRRAAVGFITPMSCDFCAACNRIRIGSDGAFYPCLMDKPAGSLLPALRPRLDPELLDHLLLTGLAGKSPHHPATGAEVMTQIGG